MFRKIFVNFFSGNFYRHDPGDHREAAGEGHRPHPGEEEEGQDGPRGKTSEFCKIKKIVVKLPT